MVFHPIPMALAASLLVMSARVCAVSIDVSADSAVKGPNVALGDIARIETSDPNERSTLAATDLGPAPRVGYERRVYRADIDRALRAHGFDVQSTVRYTGAEVSTVHVDGQTVSGADLSHCATEALTAALSANYQKVRLTPVEAPPSLALPIGKIVYQALPIRIPEPLPRRLSQWVQISVGRQMYRSVPVTFEVNVQAQAWVTTRELSRGAALAADIATQQTIDGAGMRDRLLTADALGRGLRMRRSLAAGTVLTWADVEAKPAIARGEWVALRAGTESVRIEQRVQALQDGNVGETTHVKTSAGVELVVHIVSSALVEVDGL